MTCLLLATAAEAWLHRVHSSFTLNLLFIYPLDLNESTTDIYKHLFIFLHSVCILFSVNVYCTICSIQCCSIVVVNVDINGSIVVVVIQARLPLRSQLLWSVEEIARATAQPNDYAKSINMNISCRIMITTKLMDAWVRRRTTLPFIWDNNNNNVLFQFRNSKRNTWMDVCRFCCCVPFQWTWVSSSSSHFQTRLFSVPKCSSI